MSAWTRLCRHLGDWSPRRARRTRAAGSGVEGVASESLPMVPRDWRLVAAESTAEQFGHVRRILSDPGVVTVVCATDAGREGELIFRNIYEAAGCKKTVLRLWIFVAHVRGHRQRISRSSSEPAVRRARARCTSTEPRGFDRRNEPVARLQHRPRRPLLRRSRSDADPRDDRRARARNTLVFARRLRRGRRLLSQSIARDLLPDAEDDHALYHGTWFCGEKRRLAKGSDEAAAIVARARDGVACIESVAREERSIPPPALYDLTELQRHANRLFGMSAARTLDVAQRLYEQRKLLSYPRTDSRHLSQAVAETLPDIVGAIADDYGELVAPGTTTRPLGRRYVDDTKVTDHHAILPTTVRRGPHLTDDEHRIYDLVCRRLLACWHDDHVHAVTRVVTRVTSTEVDRFLSTGTSVERIGWKALELGKKRTDASVLPSGLREGMAVDVIEAKAVNKQTRPPAHFTDATLLTAMESAGRSLPEKDLADAMREHGLGTPATRAAILEVLIERGYAVREGTALRATERGRLLVDIVHPDVKTPLMTGQWEARLGDIERGRGDFDAFMRGIVEHVTTVIER